MANIAKLNLSRNNKLYNYSLEEFNKYVINNIEYGYIDKNGNLKHGEDYEDIDFENDFCLQKPEKLLKSKCGWCFDCVELYREYAYVNHLQSKSYFLEYYDEDTNSQFIYSFIAIQNLKGLWFECQDNTYKEFISKPGYYRLRDLISSYFYSFKNYVKTKIDNPKRENFYINEFQRPSLEVFNGKMSYIDWCRIENIKEIDLKHEISSMAIVFGIKEEKGKILLLKTNHNEWVFPKGHIEQGETSIEAAKRECYEESHVNLKDAKYLGQIESYSYNFDAYDLEMTRDMFYDFFGARTIEKKVDVHAFVVERLDPIIWNEEERFIDGEWVDVGVALDVISFSNAKALFTEAKNRFDEYLSK